MNIQNLQGFRDFLPQEKRKRDWMIKKIVEVFELFGFEPIETPSLEYASLLLGKYGSEADKLIYTFKDKGDREVALRYDQTVPTARVLAQYRHELPRFFRRYQIQNVYRAEKPQKGRFREFTQCDIDIFGSADPISDAEIIACTYAAYKNIGFPTVKLRINDRTTLINNLEAFATDQISVFSIIQSIDKLDKISRDDVITELTKKGLPVDKVKEALSTLQASKKSENLSQIISLSVKLGVPESDLIFTPTLARGLDYYTGMIFEINVPEYGTNSLGGGGRYDELIELLSGVSIPAVGVAFGFDRMIEAAQELNLIPIDNTGIKLLVTVFDRTHLDTSIELVKRLRNSGISAEIYPDSTKKLDKQLKYADRKGIPYVVIIGPNEVEQNKVKLKDMQKRQEKVFSIDELIQLLNNIYV